MFNHNRDYSWTAVNYYHHYYYYYYYYFIATTTLNFSQPVFGKLRTLRDPPRFIEGVESEKSNNVFPKSSFIPHPLHWLLRHHMML